MAKYSIEDTTLTNIAEAIRTKGNTTDSLTPLQMPDAINAIQAGGGSGEGDSIYKYEAIGKTPEQIYAEKRSKDWPVLPEPTQDKEFYFLCKTKTKGKGIKPNSGKLTVEYGYIGDDGNFVSVHSTTLTSSSYSIWDEVTISNWASPQMDRYYVMRTTGGDASYEEAQSGTVSYTTMKYVLEIKARIENPSFMSIPESSSSIYTHGFRGCQFITLYGPQNWTQPSYKFYQFYGLVALLFKDDNPFAKPLPSTTISTVTRMFYGCYSLLTPHCEWFQNWNTIKTTDYTYQGCYSIEEVDIDLSNNTVLTTMPTTTFYGCNNIRRYSLKAPNIISGALGFRGEDTVKLVISNCDLSKHTSPTTAYPSFKNAVEIHNLKLSTTGATGNNPANGGAYTLRRLTMAPDATPDNVPSGWKIDFRYATQAAVAEFIESLPVTTKSKSLTVGNQQMYYVGGSGGVEDIKELAVSKGYTIAFAEK